MSEHLRSVEFRIIVDTNKQTINESFTGIGELVARVRELEEEGLLSIDWDTVRHAFPDGYP